MKSISEIWDFFEEKILQTIGTCILAAVMLLAFEEAIRRYLFAGTFFWYHDAVVYATLTAIFLYLGVALKENAHLRLDIFVSLMKKRGGRLRIVAEYIDVFAYFVGLVFCVLFVYFGIDLVKMGKEFGRTTESSGVKIWPFYVVLVAGFAFMGVSYIRSLYLQIKTLKGNRER